MNTLKLLAGTIAALSVAGAASASTTLYSNPILLPANGDCSFSTTCAADFGRGDDFAAQEFTVSNASVIVSADFIELDHGTTPTAVTWAFIAADGAGGLPGTILATGTDALTATADGTSNGYNLSRMSFVVGTVALAPGTYYLALQAISPIQGTYLGQGVAASGAAETMDGGATWAFGYETIPSVAVDVFVPEPATWALMLAGFTGVGFGLRTARRTRTAAA
ncbi:MAG TPA: PEPxxWA-CTERM sorting domain-containing protein [Caulobacteraceae bacterium]